MLRLPALVAAARAVAGTLPTFVLLGSSFFLLHALHERCWGRRAARPEAMQNTKEKR
jgi:hypothetical protein